MNKFIILYLAFVCLSCSLEDENIISYQEILPVISAEVPEQIAVNTEVDIFFTYNKPTRCHYYNDIYYSNDINQNTMAVISTFTDVNGDCTTINEAIETSFRFTSETPGEHVLKFWQGKDGNNEDIYLTHTVEIIP
jgi:hypothetical protein